MPDSRSHRGPDPRDAEAFALPALPRIRQAVSDLSWLLGRGYTTVSALKLVGDRWSLTERQRMAVLRSSCSDESLNRRLRHRVGREQVSSRPLVVDGFNVLTTIESALGGAVVLRGRDGCDRDLAGVHGSYRKVAETMPALLLLGEVLAGLAPGSVLWLLDRPVSNSGRLRAAILQAAEDRGWEWQVELVNNPDPLLIAATETVATADSAILDRCQSWLSLSRLTVESRVDGARIVDLSQP